MSTTSGLGRGVSEEDKPSLRPCWVVFARRRYDEALYDKPRWLVLNKLDLIPEDERAARVTAFVKAYRWKGPVFAITAINGEGCRELTFKIQDWLDAHPAHAVAVANEGDDTPVVVSPAPVKVRRRRTATADK